MKGSQINRISKALFGAVLISVLNSPSVHLGPEAEGQASVEYFSKRWLQKQRDWPKIAPNTRRVFNLIEDWKGRGGGEGQKCKGTSCKGTSPMQAPVQTFLLLTKGIKALFPLYPVLVKGTQQRAGKGVELAIFYFTIDQCSSASFTAKALWN